MQIKYRQICLGISCRVYVDSLEVEGFEETWWWGHMGPRHSTWSSLYTQLLNSVCVCVSRTLRLASKRHTHTSLADLSYLKGGFAVFMPHKWLSKCSFTFPLRIHIKYLLYIYIYLYMYVYIYICVCVCLCFILHNLYLSTFTLQILYVYSI